MPRRFIEFYSVVVAQRLAVHFSTLHAPGLRRGEMGEGGHAMTCVCMSLHKSVYTSVRVSVHLAVCISVVKSAHISAHAFVRTACTYLHSCLYTSAHISVHVCACACSSLQGHAYACQYARQHNRGSWRKPTTCAPAHVSFDCVGIDSYVMGVLCAG